MWFNILTLWIINNNNNNNNNNNKVENILKRKELII
jgi:hypothetical protein